MATFSHDYRFAAEPRAIDPRMSKFREFIQEVPPANIMNDRRVVRGNTYASMIIPASTQQEIERQQAQKHQKSKNLKPKQPVQEESLDLNPDQSEIPKVEEPLESETFLEAKTDPIMGATLTQIDFFIDKPPSPLFIPNEEGVDRFTQIEEGDLFNYDIEVEPILEVIIGKCLEHARMEVLEEHEVEVMRKHKQNFTQKRDAELIEVQRLQAEFTRRKQEDDRRKLQARTQRELKRIAHEKYLCRLLSKRVLSNIRFDASKGLIDLGVFRDPSETSLNEQYLPWLVDAVQGSIAKENAVEEIMENLFKQTVRELSRLHNEAVTVEYARREQIRQEELRKKKETEARKQKRNEQRAKRQAERDRIALKHRIDNEILRRGVITENVTKQTLSDSDGRHTEPVMCTPGGLLGELLIFFSTVEDVTNSNLTQEQVTSLLTHYLMNGMNCQSLVYSNLKLAAVEKLNEIMAAGLPNDYESALRLLLDFLLSAENTVPKTSLSFVLSNPESFGIRFELAEQFLFSFFSLVFSKEESIASEIKEKVLVKGVNWGDSKEEAVVRIKIPPVKNEENENENEEIAVYTPLPDDQLHDRVLLILPGNEKLSVMVIHSIAQKYFREEILAWLKNSKLIEAIDIGKMSQVYSSKAAEFEEKIVRLKSDGLPEYEFYIN